ncbi:MAG: hypothetical protein KatS3mg002_0199 [Candidatus Woesearchaeota archaeon]|nr:MAG: hypothetical protein KatS3mg002_0199 [Candidatus Woesearchaeota archaeon]
MHLVPFFLKKGSKEFHIKISLRNIFDILKNHNLIIGIFFYGLSSLIFIMVLRITDLSIAYPMTSLAYIFVTLLSYKLLKEKINAYKIIGIILIIIGVVLVKI